MLDGIARPELVGTACVERTRLLDIVIRILDEAKIVQLALRNEPYAAQNVVPVYPRREFIAISCIGSLNVPTPMSSRSIQRSTAFARVVPTIRAMRSTDVLATL